jgi:hypothetical protein
VPHVAISAYQLERSSFCHRYAAPSVSRARAEARKRSASSFGVSGFALASISASIVVNAVRPTVRRESATTARAARESREQIGRAPETPIARGVLRLSRATGLLGSLPQSRRNDLQFRD